VNNNSDDDDDIWPTGNLVEDFYFSIMDLEFSNNLTWNRVKSEKTKCAKSMHAILREIV